MSDTDKGILIDHKQLQTILKTVRENDGNWNAVTLTGLQYPIVPIIPNPANVKSVKIKGKYGAASYLLQGQRNWLKECDLIIHCYDGRIPCHRAVLSYFSPMLRDLINTNIKEIGIPSEKNQIAIYLYDYLLEPLSKAVLFLYTGFISFSSSLCHSVLEILTFFQVDKNVLKCVRQYSPADGKINNGFEKVIARPYFDGCSSSEENDSGSSDIEGEGRVHDDAIVDDKESDQNNSRVRTGEWVDTALTKTDTKKMKQSTSNPNEMKMKPHQNNNCFKTGPGLSHSKSASAAIKKSTSVGRRSHRSSTVSETNKSVLDIPPSSTLVSSNSRVSSAQSQEFRKVPPGSLIPRQSQPRIQRPELPDESRATKRKKTSNSNTSSDSESDEDSDSEEEMEPIASTSKNISYENDDDYDYKPDVSGKAMPPSKENKSPLSLVERLKLNPRLTSRCESGESVNTDGTKTRYPKRMRKEILPVGGLLVMFESDVQAEDITEDVEDFDQANESDDNGSSQNTQCYFCKIVFDTENELVEHSSSECGKHLKHSYTYPERKCLCCSTLLLSVTHYGLIRHVQHCKYTDDDTPYTNNKYSSLEQHWNENFQNCKSRIKDISDALCNSKIQRDETSTHSNLEKSSLVGNEQRLSRNGSDSGNKENNSRENKNSTLIQIKTESNFPANEKNNSELVCMRDTRVIVERLSNDRIQQIITKIHGGGIIDIPRIRGFDYVRVIDNAETGITDFSPTCSDERQEAHAQKLLQEQCPKIIETKRCELPQESQEQSGTLAQPVKDINVHKPVVVTRILPVVLSSSDSPALPVITETISLHVQDIFKRFGKCSCGEQHSCLERTFVCLEGRQLKKCWICCLEISCEASMENHLKSQHDDKRCPGKVFCSMCKTLIRIPELDYHLRMMHFKFKCDSFMNLPTQDGQISKARRTTTNSLTLNNGILLRSQDKVNLMGLQTGNPSPDKACTKIPGLPDIRITTRTHPPQTGGNLLIGPPGASLVTDVNARQNLRPNCAILQQLGSAQSVISPHLPPPNASTTQTEGTTSCLEINRVPIPPSTDALNPTNLVTNNSQARSSNTGTSSPSMQSGNQIGFINDTSKIGAVTNANTLPISLFHHRVPNPLTVQKYSHANTGPNLPSYNNFAMNNTNTGATKSTQNFVQPVDYESSRYNGTPIYNHPGSASQNNLQNISSSQPQQVQPIQGTLPIFTPQQQIHFNGRIYRVVGTVSTTTPNSSVIAGSIQSTTKFFPGQIPINIGLNRLTEILKQSNIPQNVVIQRPCNNLVQQNNVQTHVQTSDDSHLVNPVNAGHVQMQREAILSNGNQGWSNDMPPIDTAPPTHTLSLQPRVNPSSLDESRVFICEGCGRCFKSKDLYSNHFC